MRGNKHPVFKAGDLVRYNAIPELGVGVVTKVDTERHYVVTVRWSGRTNIYHSANLELLVETPIERMRRLYEERMENEEA